jgi:hypothetical protein
MKITVERHAVQQPEDKSVKLIPLTKGLNATVDASDYEWLMQWNWLAHWNPNAKAHYAVRMTSAEGKTRRIAMHREIMGVTPEEQVDHIETGNTLDNRRANLRIASVKQNAANRRKRVDNTSGYKGVTFYPRNGKWMAQLCTRIDGRRSNRFLGYFDTPEAAAAAYDGEAVRVHGKFAHLNLPSTPKP